MMRIVRIGLRRTDMSFKKPHDSIAATAIVSEQKAARSHNAGGTIAMRCSDNHNLVRRWLERSPNWIFITWTITFSFCVYFCMYAFRKPFSAAQYEGMTFLGTRIDLKSAFVVSQIIGYAFSKYVGIKICSEMTRARRLKTLIQFVVLAHLSLLAFAVLPRSLKFVALFVNGLPLGMVWGLVVWYLEGRRTSEILLAGLSASFILASGTVKDVGRWLMSDAIGVSEWWMPFVTGLVFLPLFLFSAVMLDFIPTPDEADELSRSKRNPMDADERKGFIKHFAPGLLLLFIPYILLTAFRDFRDNFGIDLFADLGYGDQPGIFSTSEIWVAFGVLVPLGLLFMIRHNRLGLMATLGIMLIGSLILGVSTAALQAKAISGLTWMVLIGLGAYLAYVPYGSVLFDRLIACTRVTGTAVFTIYVADALGYTGSIAIYFFKDLIVGDLSRLHFMIILSYFMSALGVILLACSGVYFSRVSRVETSD